jgi:RimJ/RimL family protein N-acetyltransferase
VKDDEIYGEGNTYSAQYWEYDARLGRRWNLDPKPQISISDYAVMGNNPIRNIDPKGDDWYVDENTGALHYYNNKTYNKKNIPKNIIHLGDDFMFGEEMFFAVHSINSAVFTVNKSKEIAENNGFKFVPTSIYIYDRGKSQTINNGVTWWSIVGDEVTLKYSYVPKDFEKKEVLDDKRKIQDNFDVKEYAVYYTVEWYQPSIIEKTYNFFQKFNIDKYLSNSDYESIIAVPNKNIIRFKYSKTEYFKKGKTLL